MFRKLAALLMILCLCSGCGRQAEPDSSAPVMTGYSGSVMLFCSMQEKQIQAIKAGFEEKYPGITMNYFFASTNKVLTKLATEVQAGEITADVVWTGSPTDYIQLKRDRILSPYISPQAININSAFIDEHHYYIGGRLMSTVLAYNTDLVPADQAPHTWNDLLDPKWKDRIVMTDPGSAGSSKYFVGALMESPDYGEDYFRALRANGCMLESNTASTHLQVADGIYSVGICLDYIASNLAAEGKHIAFCYPEQDMVPIYCPMGLVAGCPDERNGRLLYDYILSKEGQQILIENHLHSIRDDVGDPGIPLQTILDTRLPVDDQTVSDAGDGNQEIFDRIFFGG